MRAFMEMILLVGLISVSGVAAYFYLLTQKKVVVSDDVEPLHTDLIIWLALSFAALVIVLFIYFGETKFAISENVGQVGDFIGGLTNPILSFCALIVLLRTTLIQVSEARKTTKFLSKQQEIMEKEKFENTFFQLLERLENYCEIHFRVKNDESGQRGSIGEAIAKSVYSRREEFNLLEKKKQIKVVKNFIRNETRSDVNFGLFKRVVRVLDLVDNSNLPMYWKKEYAVILRDAMYPPERILFIHAGFNSRARRVAIKRWRLELGLKSDRFASEIVEKYYRGEVSIKSRKDAELD